ncbi:hypothetical protein CLU79DRAFT_798383 [Phycomyces nitens]|nr:hypothetical protein CLU79DRAFT_798383 [Phycomyces nitens]
MFLKTSLLILAVSIQLVLASSISILSPKANAHWHIGETVEIKWKLSDHSSAQGNLSLALASGPADALLINQVIASSVPIKTGHYKWTIPQKVKANKKYVIEVGQNAKDISFVGWIQILDPTGSGHSHKSLSTSRPTKTTQPPIACVTYPGHSKDQVRCHSSPTKQTHAPKKSQAMKPKKHGTHKAKKNHKTTKSSKKTKKTTTKKTKKTHKAKETNYVVPAGHVAI